MALVRTRTSFGGYNILDAPPRITVVQNAVVVGWALCDERRLLVPDSAFAREGLQGRAFRALHHRCADGGLEDAPWWAVDLGCRCLINEIRVFNRNDIAHERARHLIVWSSLDGATWVRRGRREQEADFGGGSLPMPWRWWQDRRFAARHVRLGLDAGHFLHLDQVEAFVRRSGSGTCAVGPLEHDPIA